MTKRKLTLDLTKIESDALKEKEMSAIEEGKSPTNRNTRPKLMVKINHRRNTSSNNAVKL